MIGDAEEVQHNEEAVLSTGTNFCISNQPDANVHHCCLISLNSADTGHITASLVAAVETAMGHQK